MLLCSSAEVAPRPCGVASLFTPHTEEPQGRTELLCCPKLHWHTQQAPPALRKGNWSRDWVIKVVRAHVQGQQLGESRFYGQLQPHRIITQRKFHLQVLFLLVFKSPRWQHVLTLPGPPCQPPLQQDRQHFQAFLSRTGSGNVTPWSNLDNWTPSFGSPKRYAPPHNMSRSYAKVPLRRC